jgi:RNA polymerase sigma factor (TIGR02999 family)
MVGGDVRDDDPAEEPSTTLSPTDAAAAEGSAGDVTQILSAIEQGDDQAAEQLLPLVYEELRKLAAARMAREKPGQTLQATALVHEAYVRLVDVDKAQHWNSRAHFYCAAAEAMRRILVEKARKKRGLRQGGYLKKRALWEGDLVADGHCDELLELDDAINKLAHIRPQLAELTRLRVYAGLPTDEAASLLCIPLRTGRRYWAFAKAWLRREMETSGSTGGLQENGEIDRFL